MKQYQIFNWCLTIVCRYNTNRYCICDPFSQQIQKQLHKREREISKKKNDVLKTSNRRSYSGYAFNGANVAKDWETKTMRPWLSQVLNQNAYPQVKQPKKKKFIYEHYCAQLQLSAGYHSQAKYLNIGQHCIRDKIKCGGIELEYILTTNMPANFVTKILAFEKHYQWTRNLRMTKL